MLRRKKKIQGDVPDLPMDSMVDIVFQLLIFFLFTFQVRMLETVLATEIAVPRPPSVQPLEKDDKGPLKLRLEAQADGTLKSATLEKEALGTLDALANALKQHEVDRPAEKRKVELRPDESVRYDVVVQAARVVSSAGWHPQLGSKPAPPKEKQP